MELVPPNREKWLSSPKLAKKTYWKSESHLFTIGWDQFHTWRYQSKTHPVERLSKFFCQKNQLQRTGVWQVGNSKRFTSGFLSLELKIQVHHHCVMNQVWGRLGHFVHVMGQSEDLHWRSTLLRSTYVACLHYLPLYILLQIHLTRVLKLDIHICEDNLRCPDVPVQLRIQRDNRWMYRTLRHTNVWRIYIHHMWEIHMGIQPKAERFMHKDTCICEGDSCEDTLRYMHMWWG